MNNTDEAVQEYLEFLKSETAKIKDEKTKILYSDRTEELLAQYSGEDKVVFSSEIEKELLKNPLPEAVKTNIEGLDKIIRGFYPGQHIVLSAPPKSGKTALVLELIDKMKAVNPLLLPLEQSAEELISIMQERKLKIPLFVTPRSNKRPTMDWIRKRIIESVVKYDTKVVFLDHFGYLKNENKINQHHMEIVDTMQELRSIAKQLSISIVSIVHVRKTNPTEPPTVEDLYGGAGYLQEADTVIMLWREAYKEGKETKWTNKVLLSVQANRRTGNTGNIRLRYVDYRFIEDATIKFEYESTGITAIEKGFPVPSR